MRPMTHTQRWREGPMRYALGLAMVLFLLTGCAGMNRPRTYAFPAYDQHPGQQADDHATCEQWARAQTGYDATRTTATGAVGGAVVGATIGAVLGAIICAPIRASGECAALGAAMGGAQGGVQGASTSLVGGREEFSQAYGACMAARGYATAGAYNAAPAMPAGASLPPPPPGSPPSTPAPGKTSNLYWYFCRSRDAYYPDVTTCRPDGIAYDVWSTVAPVAGPPIPPPPPAAAGPQILGVTYSWGEGL